MKVMFESKGDFENLGRWLKDVATADATEALKTIGSDGVKRLANGTPKATGETAKGWKAEITVKGDQSEIAWVNNAHPGLNVNIAMLIEQGHGTGTGGYVPPKPYIKQSMDVIWKTAGDKIAKELVN